MNVDSIPESAYVTVDNYGHLQLDGKRVRYWGFIGHSIKPIDDTATGAARAQLVANRRASLDLMARRLKDLGFNLYRNWYPTSNDDYTPGDGTMPDLTAYYFNALDKQGVSIWNSSLNNLGEFGPEDVGVINDPATAEGWKAGVTAWIKANGGKRPGVWNRAQIWDRRIEAIGIARKKKAALFRNKYKNGLSLADDPQGVVWELTNEEWWFRAMFAGGEWEKLPTYFRNELLQQWAGFLTKKYGGEDKLKSAWGFLLPGESLAKSTIMLLPLDNPTSAKAAANDPNPEVLAKLTAVKKAFSRRDFNGRRAEDVIEFLTGLCIAHKQRESDALKTWGKSCRLSPLIWDTGNCFQIQSGFMFQSADAVATATYIKGMSHDPTYKRWPFYSGLEAPPKLCWDVPWVEVSKQKGKPFFVYECQIDCRTKYRAEFPMRMTAAGAIGDWDIINWHIYGHDVDASKPNPFAGAICVWHDYLQYAYDEVQNSAMKVCAEIFKNGLLAPPPKPTTFIFGRKTLYDPQSMTYGKSYGEAAMRIIPTFYRYGAQFVIDPTREDDTIDGPSYRQSIYEPNPVKPNEQIEFDWSKGFLKFDAPGCIGFVGFYGQLGGPVNFRSGASFRDVVVENPDGIAYPVTSEEGYVEITVASQDGQPLSKTAKAIVSAVSTSFNSGFRLDYTKATQGMHYDGPKDGPPEEGYGPWAADAGHEPVLVARVGVTVVCKDVNGMRYVLRDWHMREIGRGTVRSGTLKVPADKPVFIIELTR